MGVSEENRGTNLRKGKEGCLYLDSEGIFAEVSCRVGHDEDSVWSKLGEQAVPARTEGVIVGQRILVRSSLLARVSVHVAGFG